MSNKNLNEFFSIDRTFTLANPAENGYNATATGPGAAGTYTREAGFLAYYEVTMKANIIWVLCFRFEEVRNTYVNLVERN